MPWFSVFVWSPLSVGERPAFSDKTCFNEKARSFTVHVTLNLEYMSPKSSVMCHHSMTSCNDHLSDFKYFLIYIYDIHVWPSTLACKQYCLQRKKIVVCDILQKGSKIPKKQASSTKLRWLRASYILHRQSESFETVLLCHVTSLVQTQRSLQESSY